MPTLNYMLVGHGKLELHFQMTQVQQVLEVLIALEVYQLLLGFL